MTQLATFDSALSINPSSRQVDQFLALDPRLPVVFVNLHEYHDSARYPATQQATRNFPDANCRRCAHYPELEFGVTTTGE